MKERFSWISPKSLEESLDILEDLSGGCAELANYSYTSNGVASLCIEFGIDPELDAIGVHPIVNESVTDFIVNQVFDRGPLEEEYCSKGRLANVQSLMAAEVTYGSEEQFFRNGLAMTVLTVRFPVPLGFYALTSVTWIATIDDVLYLRQVLAFFQKSEEIPFAEGHDKSKEAARRFIASEKMCLETNRTLQYHSRKPAYAGPLMPSIMHMAQNKIRDILGALPNREQLPFSFGPGANTNVQGRTACPRVKLSAPLVCSSNLSPTVGSFLEEVPIWAQLHDLKLSEDSFIVDVTVAPGKVDFVPKNSKTDRTIVVEPLLNAFFQKGYGSYIRSRLLRYGIDLTDQSRNQQLALQGSVSGDLATVDLSMASDCLSQELVHSLLPYDWAVELDRLRTGTVKLPRQVTEELIAEMNFSDYMRVDQPYTMQKFSSMGNGFTFELESLIFYALACAVVDYLGGDRTVSVYGDDIIVPVGALDLLTETLTYCGFSLNKEKSYGFGPFRESCGADYLHGFDIRPFYVKTLVSERTLYTMHNWMVRHGEHQLASYVRDRCNPDHLLTGPDGYGDGHLVASYELQRNRKVQRLGWDGGYFKTYSLIGRSFKKLLPGDAVLPSYSAYVRSGKDSATNPNVVRGSRGYEVISIYTLTRSIFR